MLTNLMEKGFSAGVVGMAAEADIKIGARTVHNRCSARARRLDGRFEKPTKFSLAPASPARRSRALYSFGSFVSPGSVKPIARFAPIKVLLATSSAASDPSRSTC